MYGIFFFLHLQGMKIMFTVFILGFSLFSSGQDTLRDINAFMYSLEYYLFPGGKFQSRFVHCTGITYGKGTYQQKWNKIVFTFDSIPSPQTSYTCSFDESTDSIHFTVLSAHDSSTNYAVALFGNNRVFDQDGTIALKQTSDSIQVGFMGQQITIYPQKDQCNTYTIYLPERFISYENPGVLTIKKRTKTNYYLPYVVWDEDTEKPWKKGKKRKGRNHYVFIAGNTEK